MSLDFRFAIASDLHIALPHTVATHQNRFHRCEVSIPILETVLERLSGLEIDFLLLPGDLTQDGEPENHQWLSERLSQLPYPVFVVPGNHDVIQPMGDDRAIGLHDFPDYYQAFGYGESGQLYYTRPLMPGVRLIGLNSNQFNAEGKQIGCLDEQQLQWLERVLTKYQDELVLVMVHHNIIEHLPGQTHHPLGRRYMLSNAPDLLALLQSAGVNLIFTGHLHVQDIVWQEGIYEITTGSLVSYPHPYRILHYRTGSQGQAWLQVESGRVESIPNWPDLPARSRQWIGDRSFPFMRRLLVEPPLSLSEAEAKAIAPKLEYFWADIAQGDNLFHLPELPPAVRRYLETFSAIDPEGVPTLIDNHASLLVKG